MPGRSRGGNAAGNFHPRPGPASRLPRTGRGHRGGPDDRARPPAGRWEGAIHLLYEVPTQRPASRLLPKGSSLTTARRESGRGNGEACAHCSHLEAHCVACRWAGGVNAGELQSLIDQLELTVVAFDLAQLEAARTAYSLYGRDTGHPANLNMGDCFSYALAKTRNLPLLFKGEDFIHTDVRSALKPA